MCRIISITLLFVITIVLKVNAQNCGDLYGVCSSGGVYNIGTIFHVDPLNGSQTVDFSFPTYEGKTTCDLSIGSNGKLYGITSSGGIADAGVIYEWDPITNIYTKKVDFNNIEKGKNPNSAMILYNGKFYGTTVRGGENDWGILFEWDPSTNAFEKLFDFNGYEQGQYPSGSLVFFENKLYGMTSGGGIFGQGTIFEWNIETDFFTKKIDLDSISIQGQPIGSLTFYNNTFYGLTEETIFKWDFINNICTPLYIFQQTTNGILPRGSLTLHNDKLYGMTWGGGTNGHGVIYELDPLTIIYTKKIDFDFNSIGAMPNGSLTLSNNKLYGMTSLGGDHFGGTIFEWNPGSNILIKKIDLINITGSNPEGSLAFFNGLFYGTTTNGCDGQYGGIFEYDAIGNNYTARISFEYGNYGSRPVGSMIQFDGAYYGTTYEGGSNNCGVIFKWDIETQNYIKKIDFDKIPSGNAPLGSLTLNDGKFYGMTSFGGTNDQGVLFEWNPVTNDFIKKIDFGGIDTGGGPCGSLTYYEGKFYGMTAWGGQWGKGIIFEWDPLTNVFIKKIDFSGSNNGERPFGSLTLFCNKFYGMTNLGGFNNLGVLFEWDPTLNEYSKKIDFDGLNNGGRPRGELTVGNQLLFGMTVSGGTHNYGVLFQWNPINNELSKLLDFDGVDKGSNPYGSMSFYNGSFYGMTTNGGTNNSGVLFEWNPNSNNYLKLLDFNDTIGAHPFNNQLVVFSASINSNSGVSACNSYSWNGNTYNTSGTYTAFFPGGSTLGCDSTAILNLVINTAVTSTSDITACNSYTWNGNTYSNSGTYTAFFPGGSGFGCDSTSMLELIINPLPNPEIIGPASLCQSENIAEYYTQGLMTNYNWVVSGGSINSGGGIADSIIQITWNNEENHLVEVNYADLNGCEASNPALLVVDVDPIPVLFNVMGGGNYCVGGNGIPVGLSGSQVDFDYQLRINGIDLGTALPGTGNAIDFGLQITPGIYTIVATGKLPIACSASMIGSTTINITPQSLGGIIAGGGTLYEGISSINLIVSGYTGSIIKWQKRLNQGTWIDISNTSQNLSVIGSSAGIWYYRAVVQNGVCSPAFSTEAIVTVLSRTFLVKVYFEGLFNASTGMLNKAQDVNGDKFPGDTADLFTICLAHNAYPYNIEYEIDNIALPLNGLVTIELPSGSTSAYFLVIKHRNSIETWSSFPISLNANHTSYNFTNGPQKAYGYNILQINNSWVIYSGDINQDGLVDGSDMAAVDNATTITLQGYTLEDLNVDGLVDGSDMAIIDNNASQLITSVIPF